MKKARLILLGLIVTGAAVGWRNQESGGVREGLQPAALSASRETSVAAPKRVEPEDRRPMREEVAASLSPAEHSQEAGPVPDAPREPFQIDGLVLTRDGTPMPDVQVHAFERRALLEYGLAPHRFDAQLATNLLQESGAATSTTSRESGAFSLSGYGTGARVLVAIDPKHGQSNTLQVERNSEHVILRYELSRLTVRLDHSERVPSSISVHLRTKEAQDEHEDWTVRKIEENWQSSWLVPPGSLHDLELLPRIDSLGESLRRTPWAQASHCRAPLHSDVKLAGLRLTRQVRIPPEAVHHEVALTLPPPPATSRLNLELKDADTAVAWWVQVFDEPVDRANSSPSYQDKLQASCFPASLELPEGRYSLRYAPLVYDGATGYPDSRRTLGPETWIPVELENGEPHTEILSHAEGAEVSFHLEFTSQDPQKFEWLETAYRNSGRTVQHEVILVSPSGHENIAEMDFTYGSRSEAHIALNVVPQRRLEVGNWSFFMSNETLGTLSSDFEVLEGKHNHFTLRGELP